MVGVGKQEFVGIYREIYAERVFVQFVVGLKGLKKAKKRERAKEVGCKQEGKNTGLCYGRCV